MHFPEFIKINAAKINSEIEDLLHNWSKEVEQETTLLSSDLTEFQNACKGGKRIRGALVALGFKLAGKSENPDIFKIGAAFEIFQTSILAHDDIIDKSEKRRGKPALHFALGSGHDGLSRSLCLGDIGFFLAYKIIAGSNYEDKFKIKALSLFSGTMLKTGVGELLDVELAINKNKNISLQDINAVNKLKTAYYTIASPLMLGAVLGGADDFVLEMIKKYGLNIGIAFQIKDDLNDIYYDKDRLGKEPGGDIREGKHTLLYYYALTNSSPEQKKVLDTYYGKPGIDAKGIEQIKKIFIDTGAADQANREIATRIQNARLFIPEITKNKSHQNLLIEMSDFIVK